jgi:hypothetical protein
MNGLAVAEAIPLAGWTTLGRGFMAWARSILINQVDVVKMRYDRLGTVATCLAYYR